MAKHNAEFFSMYFFFKLQTKRGSESFFVFDSKNCTDLTCIGIGRAVPSPLQRTIRSTSSSVHNGFATRKPWRTSSADTLASAATPEKVFERAGTLRIPISLRAPCSSLLMQTQFTRNDSTKVNPHCQWSLWRFGMRACTCDSILRAGNRSIVRSLQGKQCLPQAHKNI